MKISGYDYIIIGAGIYGLYFTRKLAQKYPNKKICVLEYDSEPFQRASFINQARVHNGYHYPRSLSTALKSAHYYDRFNKDYSFALNRSFEKIYAISSVFSYASAVNFRKFCSAANIPCTPIHKSKYFKKGMIDEAFITEEYSMDAGMIRDFFIEQIKESKNVDVKYNTRIDTVENRNGHFYLNLNEEEVYSNFVLNSSYASVNQIIALFGLEMFKLKYEIAEIALCKVSSNLQNAGVTVMDGPFFSLMPFGLTGLHSLSAVHYTPHKSSKDVLPSFDCQRLELSCTNAQLNNCNLCPAKPNTAWEPMQQLVRKYLLDDIRLTHERSMYAIKPILQSSEISDSRPTVIKEFCQNPTFISVLSGKFNTVYDLDIILERY
jgi:hypothetical protein